MPWSKVIPRNLEFDSVSVVFEVYLAVDVLIFSVEDIVSYFVDADFEPPLK